MQKVIKTTTHTPPGKEAGVRFHEMRILSEIITSLCPPSQAKPKTVRLVAGLMAVMMLSYTT